MEIWSRWRGDVGVTVRLDRVVHSRKTRGAFRPAPYRYRELSVGAKNAPRLCQSARLIGDMAHAQIRHHDIKFGVVKGKVLCVRFNEDCVSRPLPCECQHCRRKIDAHYATATAQQRLGNIALPTA